MNMTEMEPSSFESSENDNVMILIVDDDPIILQVMQGFVASQGYVPILACDGLEAIKRLHEKKVDIVITDINMPNMDGMELLRYIKTNFSEIGVLVVTGYSAEYSYIDVIRLGAIDFMTKPIDGSELLARLQRVVREQVMLRELRQLSIRDPLTGLYNRRHFDVKISEELHRSVRQDHSIFLALIDVDNFKGYNDTFGHLAGDRLLISLANIMSHCARYGVDHTFRQGGDEFALIITQTDVEQAKKICERIRVTFLESDCGETSLSFGLAEFKQIPDSSLEENIRQFIEVTDQTLYKAKNSGRNKIVYR